MRLDSLRDTPKRYIYRDVWGLSAKEALRLIAALLKTYPEMKMQLRKEREFFISELKKANKET